MINWQYYPKSEYPNETLMKVISIFQDNLQEIDSYKKELKSDSVLKIIRPSLTEIDFKVEAGKKKAQRINVPVLFGRNGKLEKYFEADAYCEKESVILEVEAGRGVMNYQFLKDLFQACVMKDINFFIVAVRNIYLKKNKDFETVTSFFDTLFASQRLTLPLKGILIIGY